MFIFTRADMSQNWVKCFDYEHGLVFYSHAATGDERYTTGTEADTTQA